MRLFVRRNFTLPLVALALASALRAQVVEYTVTAGLATVQPQPGTALTVGAYNGTMPGPVLRVTEGQTLKVRFVNNLAEPSSIHWHGLEIPAGMDGVPGVSRPAVAPGQEFTYQFVANESGTFWFHPHAENQMNTGLQGALIVDPANPAADPPFDLERTIILDDSVGPLSMSMGMMGSMTMPAFPGTSAFTGNLINGKTSAGQVPIGVTAGQRLRLRFINAAAMTHYVVALDGHPMTVTHADGRRVVPVVRQAIPIGVGERYDVIVDLTNPGVWSLAAAAITNRNATLVRAVVAYAGATNPVPSASFVPANVSTGTLLDYTNLAAADPVPAITAAPNRNYSIALGMTMSGMMGSMTMAFTFNGQAWPNVTPFAVSPNDQVQLNLNNTMPMMMMTGEMWHPIHFHGHRMRLMNTAGGTTAPPIKDTILIRPIGLGASSQSLQFIADNPGRWVIHCHDVMHMGLGMMGLFQYGGDADGDGLPNASDIDPLNGHPALTTSDAAAAYQLGGNGFVRVQWPAGNPATFVMGFNELNPALDLGLPGVVWMWPVFEVGTLTTGIGDTATLGFVVPNDPNLHGLTFGAQAVCGSLLPPGFRISSYARLRIP